MNTAPPTAAACAPLASAATAPSPTFTSREFDEAFELAKQGLGYVGRFRTPPSPEVYELWYSFVEAKDSSLNERMSLRVNESGTANRAQINALRQKFVQRPDTASQQRTTDELIASMVGIESIIQSQSAAGDRFGASLHQTNEKLVVGSPSIDEVKECVGEVLASNEKMRSQSVQVKIQLAESQSQMDRLRTSLTHSQLLLMTDALTGVGNRRYFDSMMTRMLNQQHPSDKLTLLLLVDLDDFKRINDNYGHDSGEVVIQCVASELQKITEDGELARYGGDEFAIFTSTDDHHSGRCFAESIIDSLSRKNLTLTRTGESIGRIGVSVGAAFLRVGDSPSDWFRRADKLLYVAKSSGGNRVMIERNVA